MTTSEILTLLALFHCVLLALATTLFGGYKTLANRLMAFALLSEALRLLAIFLFLRSAGDVPVTVEYLMQSRVLLAPMLYLYTRALTDGDFHIAPRHLLHGLPLLLCNLILFWNNHTDNGLSREHMALLQGLLTAATFIVYGLVSLWRIGRYDAQLQQWFSDLTYQRLGWLRAAHYFLLVIGIGYVVTSIGYLVGWLDFRSGDALMISILGTTTFLYVLSITALLHFRQLASHGEQVAADEVAQAASSEPVEPKYSGGMSGDEVQHFLGLLTQLMEMDKPYLQQGLKLADVGAQLGLHPQQISQIINQGAGLAFHDYINRYRVEQAMALLRDEPASIQRINDLYERCGFSSQSTFYKHFRKVTGKTPREYVAQPGD